MQAFVEYPYLSDTFFTLSLNFELLLSILCLTHVKVIFVFLQLGKNNHDCVKVPEHSFPGGQR